MGKPKSKIIIREEYGLDGIIYYTAFEEGKEDIAGYGYSKKTAEEDYKSNLKAYEKIKSY